MRVAEKLADDLGLGNGRTEVQLRQSLGDGGERETSAI